MGTNMTVKEWLKEALNTVLFLTVMGMICFMLTVLVPDPSFWSPA